MKELKRNIYSCFYYLLMNSTLISVILLIYLSVYIFVHIPLDIYMMLNRGGSEYSRPDNLTSLEMILTTVPTLIYWLYLCIVPFVSLTAQIDLYTPFSINSAIKIIIQLLGIVILFYGLIVGCLGRISRGAYLVKEKPELITSGGHALARHPQYLLYICGFIALPLVTTSVWLVVLLPGIYGYWRASIKEDQVLIEQFGQDYKEYIKKVGRFFPK